MIGVEKQALKVIQRDGPKYNKSEVQGSSSRSGLCTLSFVHCPFTYMSRVIEGKSA